MKTSLKTALITAAVAMVAIALSSCTATLSADDAIRALDVITKNRQADQRSGK